MAEEHEPYYNSAAPLVPETSDLEAVREAAKTCHACHLWQCGTQTVFGEGAKRPEIMLIGEQPGDKEDLEGHPFVGPAGRVLDECLDAAGVDKTKTYMTNAVKHFKWEPRGHRRLHKKPNRGEMGACRPWLEAEIRILKPHAIVCLGATAGQSLLGPTFKVTEQRGQFLPSTLASLLLATVHPSSLLRQPDPEQRKADKERFIADLHKVVEAISSQRHSASA